MVCPLNLGLIYVQACMEEAMGLWDMGQPDLAVDIARRVAAMLQSHLQPRKSPPALSGKRIIELDSQTAEVELLASALSCAGGWMAASRTESSQLVLDLYLRPAVTLLDPSAIDNRCGSDHSFGSEEKPSPSTVADGISKLIPKKCPFSSSQVSSVHILLADYVSALHSNAKARVESAEWLAGKLLARVR
jgi:hypothetical protein